MYLCRQIVLINLGQDQRIVLDLNFKRNMVVSEGNSECTNTLVFYVNGKKVSETLQIIIFTVKHVFERHAQGLKKSRYLV